MSLLKEIHDWSVGLKPCLRDGLRRLLLSSPLTKADHDDLFAILKVGAGIPDPDNRVAEPLAMTHLPSVGSQATTLKLLTLKNFKNVNRVAENQKIEFAPLGLTVVYGDNGTGKSGYSRVLKLACRARDLKATVLPNAHLPKTKQGTPEAKFVVDHGGKEVILAWKLGTPMHIDLSALSVFDSNCARAYLDAEQDVAYLPYGLDLVENLAQSVIPELTTRLKAAIDGCAVDATAYQELLGDTAVGKMLSTLSAMTNPATVENLATMTPEQVTRLATLLTTLQEQDPKAKASALKRTQERLKTVLTNMNTAFTTVSDATLTKLKTLDEASTTATKAEEAAANAFRAGESLLPGTGGKEWQALFESARKYAVVAHPDKLFPISANEKRCLLCQQDLNEGAARLTRFEEFLKQDTATVAKQKRLECQQAVLALGTNPITFGIDASLSEELTQQDPTIGTAIAGFETRVEERRKWLLEAFAKHDWSKQLPLEPDPRPTLTELISKIGDQAAAHELASNEEARQAMAKEHAELDAQSKLAPKKAFILAAIEKMKLKASLETCQDHIKPRPITDKSKELTDKTVTQALSDSLNREFAALNIQHLKTKLTCRASSGKTYHKLVLDLPTTHKLTDVLSEGELRAMAIASFLAELSLAGHTGGAIFDDPVSSLDHFRRIQVAKRLVEESKKRQVIIFTHDTVFLAELQSQVERLAVTAKFYHLEWTTAADFSGYCNEGLPWHHQKFDDRIDALGKKQRELKKEWTHQPNALLTGKMRTAYSHFRATIERAIESIFLNDVVKRYDNYIPIKKLKDVIALTDPEFVELHRLFSAASDVTDAHDAASGGNIPVPHPDEFEKDIQSLVDMVGKFKTRRAAVI